MRFALIDNKPTEAASGLNGGVCPGCGAPVIAKCGTHKVHHWAHKGVKMCDNWWEPETEWHRAWKNNFPKEWQEIFLPDEQTGEKHIADVKTEHGLVIEFQHSHIKSEERISREKFYRNMVWIVDGTRLKYDLPRFLKGGKFGAIQLKPGIMHVEFADDFFPRNWIKSYVPVVFYFYGLGNSDCPENIRHNLFCLFPSHDDFEAVYAIIPRRVFIRTVINGEWSERARAFMDEMEAEWQEEQLKRAQWRQGSTRVSYRPVRYIKVYTRPKRYVRRRR